MNSGGGLHYDRYSTANGQEWLMRIGAADAAPILFVPPLFEEMNRIRAFTASVMRLLASHGYGCWHPDLPGTGESIVPLENCRWADWRRAVRNAGEYVARSAGRPAIVASVRGGALLDDAVEAACHWRFAPAEGGALARDMIRASMIKAEEISGPRVELVGYMLDEALLEELRAAKPAAIPRLRTVRLESDRNEADAKVAGAALWRRSEPGNAPELAALIASDIKEWAKRCAAS